MKKRYTLKAMLLLVWTFLMSSFAFSQDSVENASFMFAGENTYESGSDNAVGYWKHIPYRNEILKIRMKVSGNTTAFRLNAANEEEPVYTTSLQNEDYTYTYFVPALKGQTLYIKVSAWGSRIEFDAEMLPNSNVGKTSSADSPLTLLLTEPLLLGDFYSNEWGEHTYYVRFTAEEDGKLELYSSQSVSKCTVNDAVVYFAYAQKRYTASVSVKAGEVYDIVLTSYDRLMLEAQVTHPTQGSIDIPFVMQEGENTVPAAAGEYWYVFEQTEELGYVSLSSESPLPGGEVRVYASESDAKYDYVRKTSEPGSFTTRFEMTWYGREIQWYFKVIKKEETATEQKFAFTIEGYQPGDKESTPIVVEQTPATYTIAAKQSKYFAVDVPANSIKMLSVEASTHISTASYTSVMLYEEGKSSEAVDGIGSVSKAVVTGDKPIRYFILWNSYEENDIEFTVRLDEVADGDIIEKPIVLTNTGKVDIERPGAKYYQYTPKANCKLAVTVNDDNMQVLFPVVETGEYYDAKQDGNCYFVEAMANVEYIINVLNGQEGSYIVLEEKAFEPGEVRSNPIDAADGIYTFGEAIADVWVAYTAQQDGYVDIAVDIPFSEEYGEYVEYGKATDENLRRMVESNYNEQGLLESNYRASVRVQQGDCYLVHTVFNGAHPGCKVTFVERNAVLGEDPTNPFVLEEGQTIEIPPVNTGKYVWCVANLAKGTATLAYTPYLSAKIYKGLENALNEKDGIDVEGQLDSSTGAYNYQIKVEEGQEDAYYIAIIYSYAVAKLTLTGDNISVEGDSPSNPIVIDEAGYVFDESTANLWFNYTVQTDGYLDLAVDVPYVDSDTEYVAYGLVGSEAEYRMKERVYADGAYTYVYRASVKAKAGEVYWINTAFAETHNGCKLTVSEREAFVGEDVDNPYILELDNELNTVTAFVGKNVWSKACLRPGQFKLEADATIGCVMYTSYQDALAEENGVVLDNKAENGADGSVFDVLIEEESEEIYFVTTSDLYEVTLALSDVGTGLNTAGLGIWQVYSQQGLLTVAAAKGHIKVFTATGVLVEEITSDGRDVQIALPKGMYVVQVDGQVQKAMVR